MVLGAGSWQRAPVSELVSGSPGETDRIELQFSAVVSFHARNDVSNDDVAIPVSAFGPEMATLWAGLTRSSWKSMNSHRG